MRKLVLAASLSILSLGCSSTPTAIETAAKTPDYFAGKKGCFLLYNMKTDAFEKVIGEANCKERFTPFSTFKVPLAAMAFDAGILKDENTKFKWDGKKRDRAEENRDHTASSWMKDSVVWYSQRITTKMGKAKLQKYLNEFNYGNKDISGGLTQAWIIPPSSKTPALAVTPYEQVDFMKRLWTNQLPVSERAMELTRKITYIEKSPKGFDLSGKTGSNFFDPEKKVRAGWFIAHLGNGEKEYIAVTTFSDLGPSQEGGYGGPRAREITKQILTDAGIW